MIGLELKIFSWRLVIILRRSQTLWVNSSLYVQIWNITVTPRQCWTWQYLAGPGFHSSLWSHVMRDQSPLDMTMMTLLMLPHQCPPLYWPAQCCCSMLTQCQASPHTHITHTGDFNDSITAVSCLESWALIGSHWPPALLWLDHHGPTPNYSLAAQFWLVSAHSLGQRQQPLAKFSTGIPHGGCSAAFPEQEL